MKEEIKLQPKSRKKKPEQIFNLLQESFGETCSVPQLLKAFYDRRQWEGETLQSYSHALREQQDKNSELYLTNWDFEIRSDHLK